MSTDPAIDILASVRAVVEERDALRVRNQELDVLSRRQGVVIARFADAVTELQAFLDETQMIVAPEAPEPSRATADVPLAPGTRLVTVSLGDEVPAPEPAIAKAARRAAAAKAKGRIKRFGLTDGIRWVAAMRAGAITRSLANLEQCAEPTIRYWVERAGGKIVNGQLVEEPESEPVIAVDADTDDLPPFLLHSHASDAASAASS